MIIVNLNGSGKSNPLKFKIGKTSVEGNCVYISVFRMALHGRFPYLRYPWHYTKRMKIFAEL